MIYGVLGQKDSFDMCARKKTILIVFGTRPEAIKMCPVVLALRRQQDLNTVVCVSGQHREMLASVLNAFDVEPDYNLHVMRSNQTLFDITTRVLNGLKPIVEETHPDAVLVHGDTTTSFAAALCCYYLGVPVGHVEAGLRTYNPLSPYPEEFNREATGIVAHWNFAPTELARQNLLSEHRPDESIYVTGNTGIDALQTTVRADYAHPILEWAKGSRLLLVTAHRRENLGEPLHRMLRAIRRVAEKVSDVKVLYPVHMNPKVRRIAHEELDNNDRIRLVEPLDVIDFHNILANSYLVLTDSGGIQEEAPSLGKPVLVMRDTTERPEGATAGTLKVVGTDGKGIYDSCMTLLSDERAYEKMSQASNPYGDGHASERIVRIISDELE